MPKITPEIQAKLDRLTVLRLLIQANIEELGMLEDELLPIFVPIIPRRKSEIRDPFLRRKQAIELETDNAHDHVGQKKIDQGVDVLANGR